MSHFWYLMRLLNQSQLCGQAYTVRFGAGHRLAGKGPLNVSSVRGAECLPVVSFAMYVLKFVDNIKK
jgi:hypothetical protein